MGNNTYWTKERIVELVEKYHITKRRHLQDFKQDGISGSGAYNAARKLGILDELFGEINYPKICLPKSYWTEERIRDFITDNNITSRTQLSHFIKDGISGDGAYRAAKRLGILDELFGEVVSWTEDKIRKLVEENNITSRKELENFRKDGIIGQSAYEAAKRLGIVNELFGEAFHWSKELCAEIAAGCKYRSEFIAKNVNAYHAALYNGWLDEITQHMPVCKDIEALSKQRYRYMIYVYEELITHSAYVGLTNNLERRDDEHRNPRPSKKKKDSLYIFCKNNNVEVPQPKILEDHLAATVAGVRETEWWHKYKNDGWNMINRECSLGYYGGNIEKKWTDEKIREYLSEHPEITCRKKFCDAKGGAYVAAYKLSILDELFGEKLNKPYTREDVIEYVRQHPEIKRRKELRLSSAGIFGAARKFNMLEELFGKPDIKKYSEEDIIKYLEEHPNIKTRVDLEKSNRGLLRAAYKLGIVNDLFGEPLRRTYTEEEIRDYIFEHPEIIKRSDLKESNLKLYRAANKLGILEDLFGNKRTTLKWTDEIIRQYIKDHPEIKTRSEFCRKKQSAYNHAIKLGILDELFPKK